MKRYLFTAPMALLPAGCATQHALAPEPFWKGDDVPAVVHQTLPASEVVMSRWQLPVSSPWARYSKMTLLASLGAMERPMDLPDVQQLSGLRSAECAAIRVAESGLPPGTLWVVDLRGAESVAFGSALSRLARRPVSLVLTFNNWPASNELIPAEETLAGLVSAHPRLPLLGNEPSVPVFLLDSWRLAYRYAEPGPEYMDNRYMLAPADLPDVETLKAQGISRVIYLVGDRADAEREEDDLNATFLEYQGAGIPVSMLDVGGLCSMRGPDPWELALIEFRFQVVGRETLRDDRDFYKRSPGGFGGVHAVSAYASGIHGFGHGGG